MSVWKLSVPKRHEVLEIALNTTGGLQEAIDAAKHGAKTRKQGITSIQQVLYGKNEGIKTIVITPNSTKEEQLKRWFSVYPVKLTELILAIEDPNVEKDIRYAREEEEEEVVSTETVRVAIDNRVMLYLDMYKLHLYSVSLEDVEDFLRTECGDIMYNSYHIEVVDVPQYMKKEYLKKNEDCHSKCVKVTLAGLDNFLLLSTVRPGINLMRDKRVEVKGPSWSATNCETGTVYTSLKGYVMEEIMISLERREGEEVYCTDTEKNVRLLGKAETFRLYQKYVTGSNVKKLIGLILFSRPDMEAYDFSTVIEDTVFRSLMIEQQRSVIKNAVAKNKRERIEDIEEATMFLGVTKRL